MDKLTEKLMVYLTEKDHKDLKEILLGLHGPFDAGRKKSEFIREAIREKIDRLKRDHSS